MMSKREFELHQYYQKWKHLLIINNEFLYMHQNLCVFFALDFFFPPIWMCVCFLPSRVFSSSIIILCLRLFFQWNSFNRFQITEPWWKKHSFSISWILFFCLFVVGVVFFLKCCLTHDNDSWLVSRSWDSRQTQTHLISLIHSIASRFSLNFVFYGD